MNFHILTLFPEMVMHGLNTSIIGRAIKNGLISIEAINIRDYSNNKFNKVDDYTYGGGAGMLMQAEPVYLAYKSVESNIQPNKKKRVIYVTPQGEPFTQKKAKELSQSDELIFLCGHYEGIDERVLEEIVTDYVSIGDYVLTGGELPTMVMIDAISRLVPGVLHNDLSAETESFHNNLLEYPQYSRPEVWRGKKVPDVILSGNTKEVEKWRLEQSIKRTKERRYDLYLKFKTSQKCIDVLKKNKLNYADMINVLEMGRANVIFEDENQILIQDEETLCYYYAPISEKADVISLINDMTLLTSMGESSADSILKIISHDCRTNKKLEDFYGRRAIKKEFAQLVYTQKNRLSIKAMRHPKVDINTFEVFNQDKTLAKVDMRTFGLPIVSEIKAENEEQGDLDFYKKTLLTALINDMLDLDVMPVFWFTDNEMSYFGKVIDTVYLYQAKEKVNIFFISK